jgi:hypothetical protein
MRGRVHRRDAEYVEDSQRRRERRAFWQALCAPCGVLRVSAVDGFRAHSITFGAIPTSKRLTINATSYMSYGR